MKLKRDDGSDIWVEYCIEEHGYPSNGWDDAGAPTIVSLVEITDENDQPVMLTTEETERLECEIAEFLDSEPYDDFSDWYD